jgi:hypothetical protein
MGADVPPMDPLSGMKSTTFSVAGPTFQRVSRTFVPSMYCCSP